ncbi:oxamate carbamoyltransferase subunit AllG family protein [Bradyrhizobium japonicum]|uniref:oxamate carbamoyltransferase subunit AllG family protein n=1 Tax=Bradyrhizobium japonicum TaxID=375 RepID=UPI00209CDA74|nr:DUF1116 domain-containing protein [Bradyrhizobium japonicum]MCP1768634.1 hypothetical protein [Bradyrhizobium japonicum]MCP1794304.1 hypothetical protein [Bradyrhizobium japonicum]MCP1810940.1 hypothetical protein [Bradyrhizobium japonicum]MCP1821207.1 hypothetical protein [Bradyrhizobium japonicum]MCP1876243.1 hypothetical protein [Bradyrhizobium japonicum]
MTGNVLDTSLHAADADALKRMHAVRPVWRGIALARDVIPFSGRTILHAGPPVRPGRIAQPLANCAIMAMIYEGWAQDVTSAAAMLDRGEVQLLPAQDQRAMVPLAAVVSPNMAVQVVADAHDTENVTFSPLNGGMALAQRLGLCNRQVLSHLRWINGNLASTLEIIADRDVPLIDIADAALADGDDLHSRTISATRRFVQVLAPRLGGDTPERRFLDKASAFFLNIWMAATKCIASAGQGEASSLVTALGGNGVDVGVKVGGQADRWFTTAASPPSGSLAEGFKNEDRLGAIGDSALLDAMGFGAMSAVSMRGAGLVAGDLAGLLPCPHDAFTRSGLHLGMPARNIIAQGSTPEIVLGILDRNGKNGRIGGGIYRPPLCLFATAIAALELNLISPKRG